MTNALLAARWIGSVLTANLREVVFMLGLAMVAAGLAQVWIPSALIVPGAVLVWLAIPPAGKPS